MATVVKAKGKQMLVQFTSNGFEFRLVENYVSTTGNATWKLEQRRSNSNTSLPEWFDVSTEMYSPYALVQMMADAVKAVTECHG